MNIEQMKRAIQIQKRLEQVNDATKRLDEPGSTADLTAYLTAYLGRWADRDVPEQQVPAPVRQFKRACLDMLATEKAALEAEFAAL